MRQHLTCVQAATKISNANTSGAEINSTEILFAPNKIKTGAYEFRIGTAGSTALLFQTLLPALSSINGTSSLTLHGGTHNPLAPTADFISHSFLPQVKKMGIDVDFNCEKIGFAPAGGGRINATIHGSTQKLKPLNLIKRGPLIKQSAEVLSGNVRAKVAKKELEYLKQHLNWNDQCYSIREANEIDGSGNLIALNAQYPEHSLYITSHGADNKSSFRVAQDAIKHLTTFSNSNAAIHSRLADQLLLPLALAGSGSISTNGLSNHLKTNIQTIEQFLQIKFKITEKEKGETLINL